MAGAPEVVEWMKGTSLRPLLSALAAHEQQEFLAALVARVTPLFLRGPHGIFFPFRRLFFVARKP